MRFLTTLKLLISLMAIVVNATPHVVAQRSSALYVDNPVKYSLLSTDPLETPHSDDNTNNLLLIHSKEEHLAAISNYEFERPIESYQMFDIVLVSNIEGGLDALNRTTGDTLWSISVDEPAVSIISNISDTGEQEDMDDSATWIVEPYGDGHLYFFTREIGLSKLPYSIRSLVVNSPLSYGDNIFTGVRKTSLHSINLRTGATVISYGATCNIKDTCSKDGKEAPTPHDTILLGKTTYELTIHSKFGSWNITYSNWGPNNIDSYLAKQYKDSFDGRKISQYADMSIMSFADVPDYQWISHLGSIGITVYDVLRKENLESENEYVCLPHPLIHPSRDESERVYLGVTENGSWYALAGKHYPSLVKSAGASKYALSRSWRVAQFSHTSDELKMAMIGVHSVVDHEIGDYLSPINSVEPSSSSSIKPSSAKTVFSATRVSGEVANNVPAQWFDPRITQPSELTDIDNGYSIYQFIARFVETTAFFVLWSVIFVTLLVALRRLDFIPPPRAILRNIVLLILHEYNRGQEEEINRQRVKIKGEDEPEDDNFNEKIIENDGEVDKPSEKVEVEPNNDEDEKEKESDVDENYESETKPIEKKLKKEVKIIEPPAEDKVSNGEVFKKRKRGARGKKKKKNSQVTEETPKDLEVQDIRTSDEQSNDQLLSESEKLTGLTLSDTILGYGSYGTVVFKGTFQNRDVAVKRMLIDFYDLASHEISLLTESDDHSNVVRYFYSETSDKFLYIALELCSASLEDVIERPHSYVELVKLMKPVDVLEQIAKGLHHLHSLKIVHRDIKPQNILIAPSKKLRTKQEERFSEVRLLISDFGLCKRLEADESSFKATTQHAAGTAGWRAPELLLDSSTSQSFNSENSFTTSANSIYEPLVFDPLSKRKLTRAIDIFSMGCVFFYILTNGSHPFGARYLREGNIIKNEYSIDALDILPNNVIEAKDLISKMIARDPKARPNTAQVLVHPFFWSNAKKVEFLLRVSDRFETEQRDPPSELLQKLEAVAPNVIDNDWCVRFDKSFIDNLGKFRKYHADRLMDLLRAFRNKHHHFNDLPPDLARKMSPLPDQFYEYFNRKFPNMLLEIYHVVETNLKDEAILGAFF